MSRNDQQQRIWTERNELQAELDHVNTLITAKEEDLVRAKALAENAQEELAARSDSMTKGSHDSSMGCELQERFSGQAAMILNNVVTKLIQRAGSNQESLEANSGGDKQEQIMSKIVDNLCHAAEDMANLNMGKTFSKAGSRVTIHRILSDQGDVSFDVLVSPMMQFKDLLQIALDQWSLESTHAMTMCSLIDEAGSTWPADANVYREICDCGNQVVNLYLESKDRVHLKQLDTAIVQKESVEKSKLNDTVAPLLGEYAISKKLKERRLAALPDADKPNIRQRQNLEVQRIQELGRTAFLQSTLSKKHQFMDVVVTILLIICMYVFLIFMDVYTSHEISRGFDLLQTKEFADNRDSLTTFNRISRWKDLQIWVQGPLYNFIATQNKVEAQSRGDETTSRLKFIMPIRFHQTRVIAAPRTDFDICPNYRDDVLAQILESATRTCTPDYKSKWRASTFFQGVANQARLDEQINALAPESRMKWLYRENDNSILDKLSLPPDSSKFAPGAPGGDWGINGLQSFGGSDSSGYVQDVPVSAFTLSRTGKDYFDFLADGTDNMPSWLNLQTRKISITISYYSANFKRVGTKMYIVRLDASGQFTTASHAESVYDLSGSHGFVYALDIICSTILAFIVYSLVRYAKAHHKVEFILAKESENVRRMRRITQTIDGVYAASEEIQVRVSKWSVFLHWVSNKWVIINVVILLTTLLTTVYFTLSCTSARFTKFPIPSPYFVDLSPNCGWSIISRCFATLAIIFSTIKIILYLPREFFKLLEPDAVQEALTPFSTFALCFFFFTLTFAVVGMTLPNFAPENQNLLISMIGLSYYLFGLPLTQADSVDETVLMVKEQGSISDFALSYLLYLLVYLFSTSFVIGICNESLRRVLIKRIASSVKGKEIQQKGGSSYWSSAFRAWHEQSKAGKPIF